MFCNSQTLRSMFIWIGVIFIIISGLLMFAGMWYDIVDLIETGKFVLTVGIGMTAIGVAFHSVTISEESDKKMDVLENLNFHRIKGLLEDRRLTLREKNLILRRGKSIKPPGQNYTSRRSITEFEIYLSFTIWKSLTYLQQIEKLKPRLGKTEQRITIHLITHLYAELIDGRTFLRTQENYKNFRISKEHSSHIKQMYDIISKFEVFEEDKEQIEILKEFRDILSENIIKDRKRINNVLQKYQEKYSKNQ